MISCSCEQCVRMMVLFRSTYASNQRRRNRHAGTQKRDELSSSLSVLRSDLMLRSYRALFLHHPRATASTRGHEADAPFHG